MDKVPNHFVNLPASRAKAVASIENLQVCDLRSLVSIANDVLVELLSCGVGYLFAFESLLFFSM